MKGGKSKRIKWNNCNKELSALVKRMKNHIDLCEKSDQTATATITEEISDSECESVCDINATEKAGKIYWYVLCFAKIHYFEFII